MQHTNTLNLFTGKRKVGIRWRNFLLLYSQIGSSEELLMSQVIQEEVLTGLLVEKGTFNKEEFLKMVNVIG